MLIENNSKLIMIGDSITDCQRGRPSGEGLFGAIGTGYVGYVGALINSVCPEKNIRVINMGNSGDTTRELKTRWQQDVIDQKPQWLSIMIGTNDVWRQFDLPWQTELHVGPEEYKNTLEELIEKALPTVKGLVLMTPYYMESNKNDAMRARMDEYSQIVKNLSDKYNTLFTDTQAAFDELLKFYHPNAIAWDRVHPNHIGHMAIARAFLKTVGFQL